MVVYARKKYWKFSMKLIREIVTVNGDHFKIYTVSFYLLHLLHIQVILGNAVGRLSYFNANLIEQ